MQIFDANILRRLYDAIPISFWHHRARIQIATENRPLAQQHPQLGPSAEAIIRRGP